MKVAEKLGFEETLLRDVVSKNRCAGCGACVIVCPFNCLEYTQAQTPRLVSECQKCGICVKVCPRYEWSLPEMEKFVFGRNRKPEEIFGIYTEMYIAKSTNKEVLNVCQDGGVATALLVSALESKLIDGAVLAHTDSERPLLPKPVVAETREEIMRGAGTKYSYSPNLLTLKDVIERKKQSVAFVGTPCHIQALRKIQVFPLRKYSNPIKFMIGLMCTESFEYESFIGRFLPQTLGINLRDVKKMNIKGKILIELRSGEVKEISLKDAKQYTRKGCFYCTDFSSEFADISLGGLGLNQQTFTIIRTEKGSEIFENALKKNFITAEPVSEESFSFRLLKKLSKMKRKRASEST